VITELRRYRIKPGRMNSWVTFFDEVARLQEEHGIRVEYAGVEPETNTFVWLRSFEDEADRVRRKASFYESRWWLEREAFVMDHLLDYSVEFLHATILHETNGVVTAPAVAPGPAAGSTPDTPPGGWMRSSRATFVAVAEQAGETAS
jgi:hypothetical protein